MIRVRADTITEMIEESISANSPPTKIRDIILECLREKNPTASPDELSEAAERSQPKIVDFITRKQIEFNSDGFGYFFHVEIDEVTREYIYGACFVRPSDDQKTRESKERRAKAASISDLVRSISPQMFEKFCFRILEFIGVQNPVVTNSSNDQGIDFFGDWRLETFLKASALPAGVEAQFRTWIVGQAKKYDKTTVSTSEIRELVGSVALAKAQAFSSDVDKLRSLKIRACDPVFYMFVTTGRITSGVKKLLSDAGVLFLDCDLIGVFLADRATGADLWHLGEVEFNSWLNAVP